MLRLTREQLAAAAQVAVATLADFEVGRRQPHPRTLAAIRAALEAAGVEFIEENGGGMGVRLRREARP
jgi:transcriptional regulator with XRE-family HTH domain